MKRLFPLFLILIVGLAIHAQKPHVADNCPTITVTGPDRATPLGEKMTFTAEVAGADKPEKLIYNWKISAGTIVEGQGTPSIGVLITKDMDGYSITAVVQLSGIPSTCESDIGSETATVESEPIWEYKLDEFGRISKNNMAGRIDNFYRSVGVANNPNATAHFRVIFSKNAPAKFRETYLNNLIGAFAYVKKDPSRVSFAVREENQPDVVTTQVWFVAPGVDVIVLEEDRNRLVYGNEFKKKIKTILQNL